ncbi:MAG: glycerol kinase GlpK [Pseudomonadota bacterium]
MSKLILALDQGTSSSRGIVYRCADGQLEVLASAQQEVEMSLPRDGWVEQDPAVLWEATLASAHAALAKVYERGRYSIADVAGIGITNQRETTVVWERASGRAIYPAIVWQDRRTAQRCEQMRTARLDGEPMEAWVAQRTGLVIDPYFSATKLAWILEHVPGASARATAGELCFGTIDSYLIWRLSHGASHITDVTNASRTQLCDIHTLDWDPALLNFHAIPAAMMPQIVASAGPLAYTHQDCFGARLPIAGIAGDQQAALVGQGCIAPGMSKSTYGTGCFVMTHTGAEARRSQEQLLTTVAYQVGDEVCYALEGSIFVAGVAIKWLRDQLGLIESAADTERAYARTGGDSAGVYVVPGFTGLGAPHWDPDVRGMITGLSLDNDRDHVITAFLQSVVFQTEELLAAMARDGGAVAQLRVDGGMVVNDALCQFLADILGLQVARPNDVETTALGAAMLAAVGCGLFADLADATSAWQAQRVFSPQLTEQEKVARIAGYAAAVRRARTR